MVVYCNSAKNYVKVDFSYFNCYFYYNLYNLVEVPDRFKNLMFILVGDTLFF